MKYKLIDCDKLSIIEKEQAIKTIAIALGTNEEIIAKKLKNICELFECDLCPFCYVFLLESIYNLTIIYTKDCSIQDFIKQNSEKTYIIQVKNNHLTCVKNNILYDNWDCKSQKITKIWEV